MDSIPVSASEVRALLNDFVKEIRGKERRLKSLSIDNADAGVLEPILTGLSLARDVSEFLDRIFDLDVVKDFIGERMGEIPPVTDEMGKSWSQPPREDILVDANHATMSLETLGKLHVCNSYPVDVYDGKMWRATERRIMKRVRDGHSVIQLIPCNMLIWFGPSENANQCTVNFRQIVLTD